MEFARVEPNELADIDFTLPADPQLTIETLRSAVPAASIETRIGCTKWGNKAWKGTLYPRGIDEKDYLAEYVKHFNSIMLTATFYQVNGADKISQWKHAADANPDFKFYPLAPQSISHIRRLKNTKEIVAKYMEGLTAFEEKLGPTILQLGDHFSAKSFPDLSSFLDEKPKDLQLFVELRNKDWFTPQWQEKVAILFKEHHVGMAILDVPRRRDIVHSFLTVPKASIRFAASGDDAVDKQRLDCWAVKIADWKSKGLQSAAFFVTGLDEDNSPALCQYFSEQLTKVLAK